LIDCRTNDGVISGNNANQGKPCDNTYTRVILSPASKHNTVTATGHQLYTSEGRMKNEKKL